MKLDRKKILLLWVLTPILIGLPGYSRAALNFENPLQEIYDSGKAKFSGFDLQKSKKEGKIVGLKQNGPAMKAGLQEGDEFTQLGYDYGNTKIPVQITLKTSQFITYSPSEPVQVLQYSLLPMKQIPSACYER